MVFLFSFWYEEKLFDLIFFILLHFSWTVWYLFLLNYKGTGFIEIQMDWPQTVNIGTTFVSFIRFKLFWIVYRIKGAVLPQEISWYVVKRNTAMPKIKVKEIKRKIINIFMLVVTRNDGNKYNILYLIKI